MRPAGAPVNARGRRREETTEVYIERTLPPYATAVTEWQTVEAIAAAAGRGRGSGC